MKDHAIYAVTFTSRIPYGAWVAEDEKRIDGYSEPEQFKSYYLAPSAEIAEAHWRYWKKFSDSGRQTKFVGIERIDSVTVLLEL